MTVRVYGIRHHGPGSARTVRAALESYEPDVVLIEGPADADPLVELVGVEGMEPPVALLAYVPDEPRTAVFWPFAVFSPEWQALSWAVSRGVPVRFCDLPSGAVLASREEPVDDAAEQVRSDPIGLLADAAGYDDPERWWEDLVEQRLQGEGPFEAIAEAMASLREVGPEQDEREERREAHMRTVLRRAAKEHERVAVVCGAWHAPALAGPLPPAAADAATLRGMAKRKATVTWVPWAHSRLALWSGYGAGVRSPGWYHHLFTAPDEPIGRWLTGVARVLRTEDLPVSSAHVIEAVRLAEALAALRGRPLAGLEEVTEATRAVLVEGSEVALDLVTRRLVVGELLGGVPDSAPTVPLEADLRAHARRLRLKQDAEEKTYDLDLRKATDLDRSKLLHRLRLLGVTWGEPAASSARNLGTFRETWSLRWRPELAVSVVEASRWGTTVEAAATSLVSEAVGEASLPALTAAVEKCLLADLPRALPALLAALDERAATDTDVTHLMASLPALVRSLRYGDVRGTGTSSLASVADALLVRVCASLPAALTGLDDEPAEVMRDRIDDVHGAVALRGEADGAALWLATLGSVADRGDVHGLVVGRVVRLLRDGGVLDAAAAGVRLSRALSVGADAPAKAAWVEGFLAGGGALLVHDADLLALLDGWVGSLDERSFTDTLPLLRRTFGSFTPSERRAVGTALSRGPSRGSRATDEGLDVERAAATLPVVKTLLGLP